MNNILITIILSINLFAYDIQELRKDFFYNVVSKQLLKISNNSELRKAIKIRKKQSILSVDDIQRYKKIIFKNINKRNIKNDEYFSVVNLQRQIYSILIYVKKEDKLYLIGSDLIASGDMQREVEIKYGEDHYFDTPTGIYEVKKGWRSTGKYKDKEKTIQSYGSKGRFVYHFGNMKQSRLNSFIKGKKISNKKDYYTIDDTLNFAIHSYNLKDPNYKLGVKASHGCVRMSDELNSFLDSNLVLHKNFYKNKRWKLTYSYEPKNIKNIDLKGSYLIIIEK